MEKDWNGVLSTNCECYSCRECGVGYVMPELGERCYECEKELTPDFETCDGYCWQEMKYAFQQAFSEWCLVNDTDEFYIEGRWMGWMKSSGHTGRLTKFDELVDNLTINGDFTLRWKYEPSVKKLSVVRSSHDEMGALFTVCVWQEGDDE